VSGNLEFTRLYETESEVLYEFTLTEDEEQEDQHEMGRVFLKENDMYLARYTVVEETIENDDEVFEMLREIN
jgi:hypothetical protein